MLLPKQNPATSDGAGVSWRMRDTILNIHKIQSHGTVTLVKPLMCHKNGQMTWSGYFSFFFILLANDCWRGDFPYNRYVAVSYCDMLHYLCTYVHCTYFGFEEKAQSGNKRGESAATRASNKKSLTCRACGRKNSIAFTKDRGAQTPRAQRKRKTQTAWIRLIELKVSRNAKWTSWIRDLSVAERRSGSHMQLWQSEHEGHGFTPYHRVLRKTQNHSYSRYTRRQ